MAIGGCTFSTEITADSASPSAVPADTIAAETKKRLTQKLGVAPDSVTCDAGLRMEVGATQRCTLTKDGDQLGMTLTATKVNNDGTVDYDINVDQR